MAMIRYPLPITNAMLAPADPNSDRPRYGTPGDWSMGVAGNDVDIATRSEAVVTDTGGVLCHSAIVAREYHIPAVVGTDYATSTFRDGELLEVDGNAGAVRVVIEEAEHEPALVG